MERITITIDDALLRQIDNTIDGHEVKNRSHAIDRILKKALSSTLARQAVVLAGGSDERLALPSGKTIKPLLEVGGKPVIEHIIGQFKKYGLDEAIICLSMQGEGMKAKLQEGKSIGMKINYLWENSPSGSAGGLLLAKPLVKDTFILSYADVLYDELDISDMIKFHKANKALCTLALANVRDAKNYGVAKMRGSQIIDFSEKPDATSSNLVNAGIAICEPEIFDLYKPGIKSFESDLLPLIAEKQKLFGYVYSGPWFELGSQTQVDAAKKYYAPRKEESGEQEKKG